MLNWSEVYCNFGTRMNTENTDFSLKEIHSIREIRVQFLGSSLQDHIDYHKILRMQTFA